MEKLFWFWSDFLDNLDKLLSTIIWNLFDTKHLLSLVKQKLLTEQWFHQQLHCHLKQYKLQFLINNKVNFRVIRLISVLIRWNFHMIIFFYFINLSVEPHTQKLSIRRVWDPIILLITICVLVRVGLILIEGSLLHLEELFSNHKVLIQICNWWVIWLCLSESSQFLLRKLHLLRLLTAKIIKIIIPIIVYTHIIRVKNVIFHFRDSSLLNCLMLWLHLCLIKMLHEWITRWGKIVYYWWGWMWECVACVVNVILPRVLKIWWWRAFLLWALKLLPLCVIFRLNKLNLYLLINLECLLLAFWWLLSCTF